MPTNNFFEKKQPWSEIKDKIISGYLTPYCAKLLATGKPLKVVDCFAGKGKFDDGKNGSPIMIANIIKNILNNKHSYQNKNIEACFIEQKYHTELENNLLHFSNCKILSGNFENHISTILEKNENEKTNLFLYIDPYGIKSLSFNVFSKLKSMNQVSTEILMNFNSFGFLREGFRLLKFSIPNELNEVTFEQDEKNSIEKMNIIANGDYWQKIILDKNSNQISMYKAEELFMMQYRAEIKKVYKHVIDIPIKEKSNHLPKYRLIYGSNHHDGVKLMIDEMNRAWNGFLNTSLADGNQNVFDIFEEPNYYATAHYNLEEEILKLTEATIHIQSLLLKLVDIFGITYRYSEYTEKLSQLSKIPNSLFDNHKQKLKVTREYRTKTGQVPTDWNWDNEIYIKRV